VGDACDQNIDADSDGIDDGIDNCLGLANPDQANLDGDALGDACDLDDDGDGSCDPGQSGAGCSGSDNCPRVANRDQANGDGDGVGDACDNCPALSNAAQDDGDLDGVGNACDNCPADANVDQRDQDGDAIGDVCDPIVNYAGFVILRNFKDWNWVDAYAIFGDSVDWPNNLAWVQTLWFGYNLPESTSDPATQGVWHRSELRRPLRAGDFASNYAGAAVALTAVGLNQVSVAWDDTSYPGMPGYIPWAKLPGQAWGFATSYMLAAPGGTNVPPDLPALTVADALVTPSDFILTPNGSSNDLLVLTDSPATFRWSPGPATGTRVDFVMVAENRVLQYWADDAAGELIVPAAELQSLPISRAFYSFTRRIETPFNVGNRAYLGIGYLETEGYAQLLPTCGVNESEPNNDAGAANAITVAADRALVACGNYGQRGDVDRFSFAASAGQFVKARTIAQPLSSRLDTVLTLYAPDGRTVVVNDNAQATSTDSSLAQLLPSAGRWQLGVSSAAPNANGGTNFDYQLLIELVNVAGQPVAFPGAAEGSAPSNSCFAIPDTTVYFTEGQPATCTVDVTGLPTTLSDVKLVVDVSHPYPADVRLVLEHAGRSVVLDDHTGKVHGVFGQTYTVDDRNLTLATFAGADPNGPWTVRASDWYIDNVGTIRSLVLYLTP